MKTLSVLFISTITICLLSGCGTLRENQNPQPKTVIPYSGWSKACAAQPTPAQKAKSDKKGITNKKVAPAKAKKIKL